VYERWVALVEAGQIAMCPVVALELLWSARSPKEFRELTFELSRLPQLSLDRTASERATAVQARLAESSQHRRPTPVDLLVAAIAERHDATVLHYDRHFDAIQRLTGQPMEWIARRGTLAD
jgi:predicted nucleic acid-binding protein